MILLYPKKSKKELLEYRILRRKNSANKREMKFFKTKSGLIMAKSVPLTKVNNEYD